MASVNRDEKTIPLWPGEEPPKKGPVVHKQGKEIVLEDLHTKHRFSAFIGSKLILGRNETRCDLQLSTTDLYMSGTHMILIYAGGRLFAEDISSLNGSFVNNQKITGSVELHIGDVLKLGHSEFRLVRFQ